VEPTPARRKTGEHLHHLFEVFVRCLQCGRHKIFFVVASCSSFWMRSMHSGLPKVLFCQAGEEFVCSSIAYVSAGGVHPPICSIKDKILPTPQWSVIFPLRTRMTSTDSSWILRWVGATPRRGPSCVPVIRLISRYAFTIGKLPVPGAHPPICCMSDSKLPTPQWSVILPFCTRITSTDSK
jgi:hypothetical protein